MLELPQNRLLIDIKTRWNSSYLMVEQFLQQQVAVVATLSVDSIRKQSEVKGQIVSNLLEHGDVSLCESFLS